MQTACTGVVVGFLKSRLALHSDRLKPLSQNTVDGSPRNLGIVSLLTEAFSDQFSLGMLPVPIPLQESQRG